MRIQLARPEQAFLSPEAYNQIFTMHGVTMMFWYAARMLSGFGNYLTRGWTFVSAAFGTGSLPLLPLGWSRARSVGSSGCRSAEPNRTSPGQRMLSGGRSPGLDLPRSSSRPRAQRSRTRAGSTPHARTETFPTGPDGDSWLALAWS